MQEQKKEELKRLVEKMNEKELQLFISQIPSLQWATGVQLPPQIENQ